ncbi:MAG: thioredoxin [Bdellovibrionales bacterium]|nr:thioredoxin [Bdellovibrionales bacterium]
MSENIASVTESNFQSEVLQSEIPTIVDFWAEWCMPCKAMAPILEELAVKYQGQVNFVKLNVDDNRNIASQYQIRGIPTLILFKGGSPLDQLVGLGQKAQIDDLVKKAL